MYSYRYEDAKRAALSDVTLNIPKGEFLAIVGHNGSGKSTLAKHLNALLLPTEGAVRVAGMDTKDEENTLSIRQKVGIVFQNPDNQLVTTVVEEDVAFGPENLGVPGPEIRKRVDTALAAVGMEQYATRAPHMLSGGQKQRIAIAGMLAMQPEVLVLDEATGHAGSPRPARDPLYRFEVAPGKGHHRCDDHAIYGRSDHSGPRCRDGGRQAALGGARRGRYLGKPRCCGSTGWTSLR